MHLDPEALGRQGDLSLQLVVYVLAVCEEVVELVAPDDRAQAGHGDALARQAEVVHADDGLYRVGDPEVDDGIDLQRDVVGRDGGLGGNVDHLDTEIDFDDPVNSRNAEDEPGALGLRANPSETEEHRPLVLGDNRQQRAKHDDRDEGEYDHASDDPADQGIGRQNA